MNIDKKLNTIKFKEYLIKNNIKHQDSPRHLKVDADSNISILYIDHLKQIIKKTNLALENIMIATVQLTSIGGGLDTAYTFVDNKILKTDNIYCVILYGMDFNKTWTILK